GENEKGQVGDGTTVDRLAPEAVFGGLIFTSIDAGFRHTCGRDNTGTLYCWGSNGAGQLGNNTNTQSTVPSPVFGQPSFLNLALNDNSFGVGDLMTVTASLTPWSTPTLLDAYIVIRVPGGGILSLQQNGSVVAGIAPIATGLPPVTFMGEIFRYT